MRLYDSFGFDQRACARVRIASATIATQQGRQQEATAMFEEAFALMDALEGSRSMYDWRDEVLYQAIAGDRDTFQQTYDAAVTAGVPAAFLHSEPEVAALAQQ